MDSGFNTPDPIKLSTEGFLIETGSSERFSYYKTRRNGIMHFVKTPTKAFSNDLLTSEALKKEFLLGYGLNHQGIVRYYSFENNSLYEEFIEGETLRELLDNNDCRLSQKGFIDSIGKEILEALRYLHSNGIVHLDLKPENIMLTRLGNQVKIIDLSCAQSISDNSTTGFTVGYEAPEQLTGNVVIGTDIYQVGKIIEDLAATSGCLPKWKKFINKATASNPDNRYKNAEEAIEAIYRPKKKSGIWILSTLIGMILGVFLGFMVIFPLNDKKEDIVSPQDIPVSENLIVKPLSEENPTPQSSPIKEVASAQIYEESVERKITKLIDNKLIELYSRKVTPMYEKMMNDETYKGSPGVGNEFMEAYLLEFDRLIAFGEELKEKYHAQSSFIDERVIRTFETKTGMMMMKLYPTSNEPAKWEKESKQNLQPDSI